MDGDEHRRILATDEETPTLEPNRKRHHPPLEFALHNRGRQCHAERTTKGRIRCRDSYGGPRRLRRS